MAKGVDCSKLKKGYTPPLMKAYGDQGWFQVGDYGHLALFEFLTYQDPDDELKHKVDEWSVALSKMNIENRYYTAQLASHKPLFLTGPAYGPDYHKWMIKFDDRSHPLEAKAYQTSSYHYSLGRVALRLALKIIYFTGYNFRITNFAVSMKMGTFQKKAGIGILKSTPMGLPEFSINP